MGFGLGLGVRVKMQDKHVLVQNFVLIRKNVVLNMNFRRICTIFLPFCINTKMVSTKSGIPDSLSSTLVVTVVRGTLEPWRLAAPKVITVVYVFIPAP